VLRAVLPLDRLPGPEVWVVIRRKVSGEASEPEWKFYLSNAPIQTPLATFVRVSGMRWPIETCFAECKGELGMAHYELRFWRGWHHHMTLVILAHHFLVRWQQRLNQREGGPAPHDHPPLALAR
jgi:SRSO17 transposase